jgi:hypothetical protein
MKLSVSRMVDGDTGLYSVEFGGSTCPAMSADALRNWLSYFGLDESVIAAVLDIGPSESINVDVPNSNFRRAA